MKNTVFWDVKPCNLVEIYQRFEGTSCLHLQVQKIVHVNRVIYLAEAMYCSMYTRY
jgi:hypothetical protein